MESEDFSGLLAERTHLMQASVIREILKVVSRPGMVSLAGGIPAPESFPIDIIEYLTARVISKYGPTAFQYDLTEGFLPFRQSLVRFLANKGVNATVDEILAASGSQSVLDTIGKILITRGDKIALEAPTYLGAIQAFNSYEPEYVSMATDDGGLIPESLEENVRNHRIKFIPAPSTRPLRASISQAVISISDSPRSSLATGRNRNRCSAGR